jgi:hypothetical protein
MVKVERSLVRTKRSLQDNQNRLKLGEAIDYYHVKSGRERHTHYPVPGKLASNVKVSKGAASGKT